jgi:hypothetical protein
MTKTFQIVRTSDENFVGEVVEVNMVHLIGSMQFQTKEQKFYLSEITVKANFITLKSGQYEIELKEVL